MDFITHKQVMEIVKRDVGRSATPRLIDESEVGNDEGADVMVVVVEVHHPAMPDLKIDEYTDHRFYIFKRGQTEHAAFSGNI